MAADVWQLMRRLDLITPEGNLSSVARSMLARRQAPDDYSALSETLATQIKTHYRGLLNLSICELLQESARGSDQWRFLLGWLFPWIAANRDTVPH